jgi:iron-sulfur cluster repair protein YtfE (RIC family)
MDIDLIIKLKEQHKEQEHILEELLLLYESINLDSENSLSYNLLFHNINSLLKKIENENDLEQFPKLFQRLKYYSNVILKFYIS